MMVAWILRTFSKVGELFRQRESNNEFSNEVEAHLELLTQRFVHQGMTLQEAIFAARRQFGNALLLEQRQREARGWLGVSTVFKDMRYGIRMLAKSPGITTVAIMSLALGIGANTAIFTVINAVLLKPLTYPDADHIVHVYRTFPEGPREEESIPEFRSLERQASLFKEIAGYDASGPGFNLTGDRPEEVHGIHVTESYFRIFGAPVILGRTFTTQEDSLHGGKVIVLSYGLWQRRFGSDPSAIGKSLFLGNEPYTIVGVIGKQFVSMPEADLWLPFQFPPVSDHLEHFFNIAALLQPGVTVSNANAQLKLAAAQFLQDYPKADPHQGFAAVALRESIVGDSRKSLLTMLGAVSLVLLIACANVANLLLARASGRKREFAIRSALGASRIRIVRQLLIESILMALAGGILGFVLGFAGVRALLAISPAGLPRIGEDGSAIGIDWRVLAFTLSVSLLTGILFGLFPALSASRSDLNSTLKESSNRSNTGFRQGNARSLLVVSEVSLALVLLIGSALLIRTFIALHDVAPGFDSHNILTLDMSLNGERYHKTAGVAQLVRDGRERLNAIHGVELSAAAYWLPIDTEDGLPFQIPERPEHCCGSKWMSISPGYLSLFRIPILRGRDFTENDTAAAPGVALINEALARQYWPNENPVGRQILIGSDLGPAFQEPARKIIGVVADFHNAGLSYPSVPMMIVPIAQVTDGATASYSDGQPLLWLAKTDNAPQQSIAAASEQLRLASGGFPVAHVRTMDDVIRRSTARQSFNMLVLSIFGASALVLAAIGIYGLMAYSVEQRRQEMGIRMALGADRNIIRKLVVWQGMRLALAGIAAGLVVAFGLTRLIASFLFGVKPWDPVAFFSVPLLLAVVALLAAWLPARRASQVDPMQALRAD
jgi:predicted permease